MKKYSIPILLAAAFFIIGIVTLSDYGINWDTPSRMLRGQAYAQFFLTGKYFFDFTDSLSPTIFYPGEYMTRFNFIAGEGGKKVSLPDRPLFKKISLRSFYQNNTWSSEFFKLDTGHGHPPLPEILGSFSNRFFYQTLHIFTDLDSYNIPYLFISAFGVFIVSLFAFELTNSYFASIVAGLSLALFPLFFAEAHFNLKDPTQASFFAGSIWAFWHWVKSGKLGWFGVFGVFGGLALSVKWNIVFLPLIILPWLFLIRFKNWGKLGFLGILGCLGVFLFLVLIWPPFWQDPFSVTQIFNYYLSTGAGGNSIQPSGFILPFGFNVYPLILLFSQTPEIILIFGVIGVIVIIREIRGDSFKTGYLLLLWLLVPIIRYSLPFARSYSGIRQIMEVLPVMAILVGVGAEFLAGKLKNFQFSIFNFQLITLLVISYLLLVPIIKLHPNENVYFNNLVGGINGAYHKNLVDPMITYGNIYRQAVLWLNQNAEHDANVAIVDGYSFAASPLYFRDDISLSPYHFSGFDQKGEYIMSSYNSLHPSVFAYAYPEKFLTPLHIISVDGVDLLTIYKNDHKFAKKDLANEQIIDKVHLIPIRGQNQDYFQLDLNKKVFVTRIKLQADPGCINQNQDIVVFRPRGEVFESNEIKDLGNNILEFYFPAIESQVIEIYPQNEQSCFLKGKVLSISFLNN